MSRELEPGSAGSVEERLSKERAVSTRRPGVKYGVPKVEPRIKHGAAEQAFEDAMRGANTPHYGGELFR